MAKGRGERRAGEWLAEALDEIQAARLALLDARAAERRGDRPAARRFERESRQHLQAARRALDRAARSQGKRTTKGDTGRKA